MTHRPPTLADILASDTAAALPREMPAPKMDTRRWFQAIDNMIKVFAIRPDDEVLFLTDPLLDRRVVEAISGIAASREIGRAHV